MELGIIKQENDLLELWISGEGHTLCNVLRDELTSLESTSFASYSLGHPLIGKPVLALKVKKGNPLNVLTECVSSLKAKNKELRDLLAKL